MQILVPHAWTLIYFYCRMQRVSVDYITVIHESLSKICKESCFEGLNYYGGPKVMCEKCNEILILPCMKYEEDMNFNPHHETCHTQFCVNEVLSVSKLMNESVNLLTSCKSINVAKWVVHACMLHILVQLSVFLQPQLWLYFPIHLHAIL